MPRMPIAGPELGSSSWLTEPCPLHPYEPDPVRRLLRLLARSAAHDMGIGVANTGVSSFSVAVGSYRP
jgi:hypothetical protein